MLRFMIVAIALIIATTPVWAGEREIKSTGGASLGKYKFRDIDATDALLVIEHAGRRLLGVKAGYIGNDSYREHWRFDNSYLTYDKLTSGSHYLGGAFTERDGVKLICGADVEQKCEVIKSDKASKNLIIVQYRLRETGALCAGLIYVDEEIYSEGYGGSYGDYNVRSVSCVPAGGDADEALALSAHYLSLVKKDGRRIANLARYDLPSPKSANSKATTPAGTRSGSGQKSAARSGAGVLCRKATSHYLKWEENYPNQVKQAKLLGLGPDCRVQLGLSVRPSQPNQASSKPQASSTSTSRSQPTTSQPGWEERSLALKWDGVSDLLAGKIYFKRGEKGGRLSIDLPRGDSKCSGTYRMGSPEGTWAVACPDGTTASGTYTGFGSGKGAAGEGDDSEGRKIRFTVSSR